MTIVKSSPVSSPVATRRWPRRALGYLPVTALVLDLALIAAATVIAVTGRQHLDGVLDPADVTNSAQTVGPLIALGWLGSIAVLSGYEKGVFGSGIDEFKRLAQASALTVGLVGVACYLAKYQLSRGFFVLEFAVGLPLLLFGRVLLRRAVQAARRRGALRHRVVVAGSAEQVDEVVTVLRRERWLGYDVVGCLTSSPGVVDETALGVPVLGSTDAITLAPDLGAEVVFFAGGAVPSAARMREAIWALEHRDVQVVIAPSVSEISHERIRTRPVGGLPLMHVDPPTWSNASHWGKRLFDVVGSLVLIVLCSPVLVCAALRVKLHDRGPVLFRQRRIGRDGREFRCLKFRTMVVDAEARVGRMQEKLGRSALLFKMKDDPRVTRPGRWLRRFSLDELPQLFNVLKGDMSLVGPRPQVDREVALYDNAMSRRLHVRPGMTGLWQVSGRNDLTAEEAIRLDLYYIDNWSMLQDLWILAKTAGAVLGSRGAY